jgi:hypothetical protein
VNLVSPLAAGRAKRSGYGMIFYRSSGSGNGEFWGGDQTSALHPPGRYCTTGRMVGDSGRAWIWFKATTPGILYIQAETPADANKHTKLVQLAVPVKITVN